MTVKDEYRIIGSIYYECLKPMRITQNINDYFGVFLDVPSNSPTQSDIMKFDYFPKLALIEFKEALSDKDYYKGNIKHHLGNLSDQKQKELNDKLKSIVENVKDFSSTPIRSSGVTLEDYDTQDKRKLLVKFNSTCSIDGLVERIYLLIYFAVYKRIPSNIGFGYNYRTDLEEFNREVTCKYGVTSKPGVRAIIRLAERDKPNIFALYEYADMLYYGSKNGPSKDLNKAFNMYKQLSGTDDDSLCHPLAHWTLAYIFYNYKREKTELEFCDDIPEIEEMSFVSRYKKVIEYAQYAVELDNNPAAANVLGKICLLTDEEYPGIEDEINKAKLLSAKEYFKKAVDQNYIYAYASLSNIYLEEIFTDESNKDAHISEYINTLKKSAEQYEPWAANTLGKCYLDGKIVSRKNKTLETTITPNRKEALRYFHLATDFYNDVNSGWAYANMIISFPNEYLRDDYDDYYTLNNHIERLVNCHNKKAISYFEENFEDTYGNKIDSETVKKLLTIVSESDNS